MADDQPTQEQWLPVVGYEGLYEVSDQGRVRSLDRDITNKLGHVRRFPGKMLTPYKKQCGHLKINLSKGGEDNPSLVHRLVLTAFVGPCPEGMHACHWNDDGTDNRLSNLRWGTSSENKHDAVRNGKHVCANKTHCPHGHRYAGPNLYMTKKGGRTCMACKKARSFVRYRPALKSQFHQIADREYAVIMAHFEIQHEETA